MRNLIVCLDGTDNEFSANNTNVVRMYQCLEHDPERQVAYYDPGVGTIWEPGTISKTSQKLQMLLGLAFGLGVTQKVSDAYLFLMREYQPGDRLFIFGFSRGALEARALAGLIHRCGLLKSPLESLQPYAMQLFEAPHNDALVNSFRETFSRDVQVTFLGLWDTVTSFGNVWSPIDWPNTTRNPSVAHVAHAIAIDERRAFFRPNRWSQTPGQSLAEVWFAGVHCDVGGGYDPATGRLWAITLQWMIAQAAALQLVFVDRAVQTILSASASETPDFETGIHDSLTGVWKALELVPRRHRRREPDGTWSAAHWMIPAWQSGLSGRPRELLPGERVHRTAIERLVACSSYRPPTLVRAGLTVEVARQFLATGHETWTVPEPGAPELP